MPQLSESAPRASISVQVKQGFWEAHLQYADDAQLYIGLKNCNCSASIDCLELTLFVYDFAPTVCLNLDKSESLARTNLCEPFPLPYHLAKF